MALLSPEFVNRPSTLLGSAPDSTQTADQPRPRRRPGPGHRRAQRNPTATAAAQKRQTLHGLSVAPSAPARARRQPRAHAPAILRGTPPHFAAEGGSTPRDGGRAASPAHGHRARSVGSPPPNSLRPLPASVSRGPRLPGVAGRGSPPRASHRLPADADEQPRRPDPPRPSDFAPLSFSPLWKPPIRISPRAVHRRKGGNRKGGEAATFSLIGYAAPRRGLKVGRIRTAADRGRMLPASCRPLRPTAAPRDARAGLPTLAAGVRPVQPSRAWLDLYAHPDSPPVDSLGTATGGGPVFICTEQAFSRVMNAARFPRFFHV